MLLPPCTHIVKALLLLLLVLPQHNAAAQDNFYIEKPKLFVGGLVAGASFTQVDGDRFAGYNKVGLNVGGVVYTQLSDNFAISMEILFSQKGAISTEAFAFAPGLYITTYRTMLNYAEIPVMLNYVDKHKSKFGAGFSYSRLATSSETITTNPPQAYDLNQYPFKKSDYNFLVGGSLHLWKGLFLNGRFQYSLLSIRDKIPQSYIKTTQYNNVWTVRLMYLFM